MRVVFAEDNHLLRQGIVALLREVDELQLVASVEDLPGLLAATDELRPDAVLSDIRLPPTRTSEGIDASFEIRRRYPGTGVLLLSQYLDEDFARSILRDRLDHVGYLLKERVRDVDDLVSALRAVTRGGVVVDPEIIRSLLSERREGSAEIARLTERERAVLEQMARGKTNKAIARALAMSERSVERHISSIFSELGLVDEVDVQRRVMAVLTFLEQAGDRRNGGHV